MPDKNRFKHILKGEDVTAFLNQFVAPPGSIGSSLPADIAEVQEAVEEIWAERGLLTPTELEFALIDKYSSGASSTFKNFIRGIELSRNEAETVTRCLGKEHAYIATGLAHLYAVTTKNPVSMIEIDFSNMTGTNEYFRQQIARETGMSLEEINNKDARGLTDMAIRLTIQKITTALELRLPPGARIIPIRTGGDEVRILIDEGEGPEAVTKDLLPIIDATIERSFTALGLLYHPPLKKGGVPGLGAGMDSIDMRLIRDPSMIIEKMDKGVTRSKKKTESARRQAFNSESNSKREVTDTKGYKAYIELETKSLNPIFLNSSRAPEPLTLQDSRGRFRPAKAPPMMSPRDRRMALALAYFTGQDEVLTPDQWYLLKIAAGGMTAVDPSSRALMPHDSVLFAGICAAETARFREIFPLKDKNVVPHVMGVSFHGLAALNKAFGHDKADIVLRHMVKNIIEKALSEEGIESGTHQPYAIAHHDGANFSLVFKPGGYMGDGTPYLITVDMLKRVERRIGALTEGLNNTDIAEFFGVDRKKLKKKAPRIFAELPDSKDERIVNIHGQECRGRIGGLHAVTLLQEIDPGDKGFEVISRIRTDTDRKMDDDRAEKLYTMSRDARSGKKKTRLPAAVPRNGLQK